MFRRPIRKERRQIEVGDGRTKVQLRIRNGNLVRVTEVERCADAYRRAPSPPLVHRFAKRAAQTERMWTSQAAKKK
jgi:hypothetical protein